MFLYDGFSHNYHFKDMVKFGGKLQVFTGNKLIFIEDMYSVSNMNRPNTINHKGLYLNISIASVLNTESKNRLIMEHLCLQSVVYRSNVTKVDLPTDSSSVCRLYFQSI